MRELVIGTDEELIKRCAEGDHSAFDTLFKKYGKQLTFFIHQIINDFDRAQDIFQDTFIKVLEKADQFNDKFRFSTWLYRIALNLSINELKRKQRENNRKYNGRSSDNHDNSEDILNNLRALDTPQSLMEKQDMIERVTKALNRIPGAKRTAFILKFYHNLSYEEIAGVMECSKGTVKSRIHYALEHLQVLVGE